MIERRPIHLNLRCLHCPAVHTLEAADWLSNTKIPLYGVTTMQAEIISTTSRRNVSRCSRDAGGVNGACHTYNGVVVQVGNDVMAQPKVVPIYWNDTILGNAGFKLAFDQFFSELLNSEYVERLAQYGVQQPIVLPSFAVGGTAANVTMADVATQLATWIGNNSIPAPSSVADAPNWYYVILAPDGAIIGQAGECGYHSSSTLNINGNALNLAWGLVAFSAPAPGATPADVVNSVSYCLVHEMVEALTNPRSNGWSVNVPPSGGDPGQSCEIGDLCEARAFHNVGRWNVETYWSNQDNGCVGNFGPDWSSLGSPRTGVLGAPVVGHDLDGRLEVFVVSKDGDLWQSVQTSPDGAWQPWQVVTNENPVISAPPRVGINLDGRIEVFGVQAGGTLWHIWQIAPNGGWSAGATIGAPGGGIVGGVSVANEEDGRLEAFGIGSDHNLHHITQTAPNSGWSPWSSLGAPQPGISIGDPRVTRNTDGRLEAFLLADDQSIWHIWQTAPNGGWSGWSSLGRPANWIANGAPFIGNNSDGRIEVFTTGEDGGIYHVWQTAPNNGWSSWVQLQAPLPGIQFDGLGSVTNDQDGRFQLFFVGTDGALWTLAQSHPNNGWGSIRFLDGAPPADALNADQIPATGANANGDLAAFVTGADGNVWEIVQASPGGPWGTLVLE